MGVVGLTALLVTSTFTQNAVAEGSGLLVVPDASDVVASKGSECPSIQYTIPEPFPAVETLAFIQSHLAAGGWMPVKGSDLVQNERSSLESGWQQLTSGDRSTQVWSARWRHPGGGDLQYTLTYGPLARGKLQPTSVSLVAWSYSQAAVDADKARTDLALDLRLRRWLGADYRPRPIPCVK
jgi:hypothetical protein